MGQLHSKTHMGAFREFPHALARGLFIHEGRTVVAQTFKNHICPTWAREGVSLPAYVRQGAITSIVLPTGDYLSHS
jgi:hypothetical protein